METVIIYLLAICALLCYWKRQHQKLALEKFKYRMFGLRDRLRRLAINGVVDSESMIFDYYDLSISKNIHQSYFLTFPALLMLRSLHKDKEHLVALNKKIMAETDRYPELKALREEMTVIMIVFMMEQHYVTYNLVRPFISVLLGARKAKRSFDKVVALLLVMPETSASDRYEMSPSVC